MSLWQRYRHLTPRTRLLAGAGVIAYATLGLFASDTAEKALDLTPTAEDEERLRGWIPRVSVVERREGGGGEERG